MVTNNAFSPEMFDTYIDTFGMEITVITVTPKIIDGEIQKNKKGKIITEEETSPVTARILENPTNEVLWNNMIQQKSDAIGLFHKTDKDKLNENSRLLYNGQVYYMKEPKERFTHMEVPLSKKKV
jgi:hypothetical protein